MALTRRTLVLGLAATIAGGCAGEKSPVTADNAKRITRGMTFRGPKDRVEVIFEDSKVSAVRLNGTPILE